MLKCFDVANYFLILVDREAGDSITQLKLQKLVYFAQGVSLGLRNKKLFDEPIEAWEHGPVTRSLRKTFGAFESNIIPAPGEIDFDIYSGADKKLIYKIYSLYGEHTASYLRNLTHNHPMWQEAIVSNSKIIEPKKMQEFFKKEINKDFLSTSTSEQQDILEAEDRWWMNYDSGVPSEDVTAEILAELRRS